KSEGNRQWVLSSRSAASACPRRSTARCCVVPAFSVGNSASRPLEVKHHPRISSVGGVFISRTYFTNLVRHRLRRRHPVTLKAAVASAGTPKVRAALRRERKSRTSHPRS